MLRFEFPLRSASKMTLDLPPEIWSTIGKLAIDNEEPITAFKLIYKDLKACPPAVTQVCKLLRGELLPYFFSTKINIRLLESEIRSLLPWLRTVETSNRRLINGICFLFWDKFVNEALSSLKSKMEGGFPLYLQVAEATDGWGNVGR